MVKILVLKHSHQKKVKHASGGHHDHPRNIIFKIIASQRDNFVQKEKAPSLQRRGQARCRRAGGGLSFARQYLHDSKIAVYKHFFLVSWSLGGKNLSFLIPKPQLGNVEFWLAKLLARLAEQTSRSGGLRKQEKKLNIKKQTF